MKTSLVDKISISKDNMVARLYDISKPNLDILIREDLNPIIYLKIAIKDDLMGYNRNLWRRLNERNR